MRIALHSSVFQYLNFSMLLRFVFFLSQNIKIRKISVKSKSVFAFCGTHSARVNLHWKICNFHWNAFLGMLGTNSRSHADECLFRFFTFWFFAFRAIHFNLIIYIWLKRKFILNKLNAIHCVGCTFGGVSRQSAPDSFKLFDKSIKVLNEIMKFSIENCL